MKSDSQLQSDVMAELEWEPSVDHADIGVSVVDGVVTLNGYVKSFAEKVAAERAVKRVGGVKAIAEELRVRLISEPKSADHEIARRILDMLEWTALVPRDKILVKVEHGWVTLTGEVDWRYQSEKAGHLASSITGVTGVSNNIVVAPRVAAADVRQRIQDAFKRQADLDAACVTITVEGGLVTLSGRCPSSEHLAQLAA